MAVITYIAQDDLASGHLANTEYNIEFSIASMTDSLVADKVVNTSIGGQSKTWLKSKKIEYPINVELIRNFGGSPTPYELWREFRSQAIEGYIFQLDLYGSISEPDNPFDCIVEQDNIILKPRDTVLYWDISFAATKK